MGRVHCFGGVWELAVGKRGRWYCCCACCASRRSWLLVTRCASPLGALLVGIDVVLPFDGMWYQRWVDMGGGIASRREVLLGVPGSSSLVVLHHWAPCSSVLCLHLPSVVGRNKRWVNVGGGMVSARAVLLGVFVFSSLLVFHLWALCSSVSLLHTRFGGG